MRTAIREIGSKNPRIIQSTCFAYGEGSSDVWTEGPHTTSLAGLDSI